MNTVQKWFVHVEYRDRSTGVTSVWWSTEAEAQAYATRQLDREPMAVSAWVERDDLQARHR